MNRVTVKLCTGSALIALMGVVGSSMGCQLVVGSGDYAVGSEDSGATTGDDGSGGGSSGGSSSGSSSGGGDGSMTMPNDGGTSPDQGAQGDGPAISADGSGAHVGDPCLTNANCPHGSTCQGLWCTEPCASSGACGANSAQQPNLCLATGSGSAKSCVPGCDTNDDCSSFPGTACTPASATASYCAVVGGDDSGTTTSNGNVGDPCSSASDCTAPANCDNGTWCSVSCASPSDTSCGSNSLGQSNYCLQAQGASSDTCFPGCLTNEDCTFYSGTVCVAVSSTVSVCGATSGDIGDPCSTDSGSQWTTACTSPADCSNDTWCSIENCTTDASCGSNTAGQANFCVPTGSGSSTVNYCFPGCTQNADCAAYTDTFCEQIFGSTRGFVCAYSNGGIGDPCATDADCTTGSCLVGWCTQSCSSPSDTSCGTRADGVTENECVFDQTAGGYQCDPGCIAASDCVAYAGTTCQTVSGQNVCTF